MNGNSTGLEPTDSGGSADSLVRWRRALTSFNETALRAAEVGEQQLQRLAQDATARAASEVLKLEEQQALQQRRLDGQNQEAARQEAQ